MKRIINWKNSIVFASSIAFFTGCNGTTSVSVGYGVYGGYGYPSYGYGGYYGRPGYRPPPPVHRPPGGGHRPPPGNRPPAHRPPGHKPPSMGRPSTRPVSRPSGGMRRR